jgi:hypothetical protein
MQTKTKTPRVLRARYLQAREALWEAQNDEAREALKADGDMTAERHVAMVGVVYSARNVEATRQDYVQAFRDDLLATDAEFRRLWSRFEAVKAAATEAVALQADVLKLKQRAALHVPEADALDGFSRGFFDGMRQRIHDDLRLAFNATLEAVSRLQAAADDAEAAAFSYFDAALDAREPPMPSEVTRHV